MKVDAPGNGYGATTYPSQSVWFNSLRTIDRDTRRATERLRLPGFDRGILGWRLPSGRRAASDRFNGGGHLRARPGAGPGGQNAHQTELGDPQAARGKGQ